MIILCFNINIPPQAEMFIADFEMPLWNAVKETLEIVCRGCAFHANKAMYAKIVEVGLAKAYHQRDGVHRFCKHLMALQHLPPNLIKIMFEMLCERIQQQDAEVQIPLKVCNSLPHYIK